MEQKLKAKTGRPAISIADMPTDPNDRLSNLMETQPERCEEFLQVIHTAPCWSDYYRRDDRHRNMYVRALLYGRFDRAVVRFDTQGPFRRFVEGFFGLENFNDCFTEKRREFLQSPAASYQKNLKNGWNGPERRAFLGLERNFKALLKHGFEAKHQDGKIVFHKTDRKGKGISFDGIPNHDC